MITPITFPAAWRERRVDRRPRWSRGLRADAGTRPGPGRLVPAGRHVAPVLDRVVDGLHTVRPVAERQLPVADLAAGAVLLHVVPVAERVLVLELGALEPGEG